MTVKTPPRRKARELTLQALYAAEHGSGSAAEAFAGLAEDKSLSEKNIEFSRRLFDETMARQDWADGHISRLARNWRIERINAIDRTILRMAMCEFEVFSDVPAKVVINEAIELAKTFSTPESSSFVNGILDSFVKNADDTSRS
jgi:N utilization substance protein B